MSVLSLINPLGWFGAGNDRYRAKLTEGDGADAAAALDPRGRPVSTESALQVSAFWACVRIIAETIATLPLQLFQHQGAGGRGAQTDHPLYALLHDQPNADHTAMEFIEGLVAYLAVAGNAYVRKETIGGRLVALTLLRTPWMNVRREQDGSFVYAYTDYGRAETYTDAEIMHVRGFGFGDDFGLSALTYARRTLGIALAADEAADASFANGLKMSGFFKYKGGNGILQPEQRKQAKKILIDPYVGAGNAAKVGLLEGDFDWIAASMPPEDAQLLESRRFGVEDVCRWLGVPPILIGHSAQGQTMWGSGVEQIMLGWLAMGLRPYLVRIEQAIKRSLLTPEDKAKRLYTEFNVDGLLRADSKARAENYSRLGQNGILTRNEMRALENMPAMPGGDDLTVQSNLVPVADLGKIAELPRLKPVEPGEAVHPDNVPFKLVERLLALKYSVDQPRDAQGRFAAGGGGSGGAPPTPQKPARTISLKDKLIIAAGGVLAIALAADHVKTKYRAHSGPPAVSAATRESLRSAIDDLHARSVRTPLSDAEHASLNAYTLDAYKDINRKLRLGHKDVPHVDAIDSALAKSELAENTVVYRGLNKDRSKRLLEKYKPGDVMVDKGFGSTSLSQDVARAHAGVREADFSYIEDPRKHGYVWSVNVDKGTPALPLGGDKFPMSSKHGESEVLLPRASAYKLLSVDHDTKTIHMQHVHVGDAVVAAAERKSAAGMGDDTDRFTVGMDDMDHHPAPDGDTTARDYAGYRPPQPDGSKRFDPSQPRNEQGEWSEGGGVAAGGDAWAQVGSVAKTLAIGVGLTAAVVAAVALAPELFALAGGVAAGEAAIAAGATAAEAVAAATTAGRLAQVTALVDGAADQMFNAAAFQAGTAILKDVGGVDAQTMEKWTEPFRQLGLAKAASGEAASGGSAPITRETFHRAIEDVAAKARDALIGKIGGTLADPGISECRQTIRAAYRRFVAAKL